MALIIGSLFNGQRPTAAAARNYFGVSFLSMMFLSMGAMPEMGITFANKPCAPSLSFIYVVCTENTKASSVAAGCRIVCARVVPIKPSACVAS